ncbi:hypothetical protein BH18CHL2_BH18CHL2_06800 [soil metagenome]
MTTEHTAVVARARRIADLATRRTAVESVDAAAAGRARQLDEHVRTYVLPRITSLDAPLLVVLLGPTGAGKSSLMNALAGGKVSPAGVLRPTTREAVVLATEGDAAAVLGTALASVPPARLRVVSGRIARPGLVLVDAPDIDSVERENRVLADSLVEAADLCMFVTTASRYADRVPWDVLHRVRDRRLPLVVVVNRLPDDERDRADVLSDIDRLLEDAGLRAIVEGPLDVVAIREGDIDEAGDALAAQAVAPVRERIDALAADREARRSLAERALEGALAGLAPLVAGVADDLNRQADAAAALRRESESEYEEELEALRGDLRGGRFMREEVLRQWQSFVNADQITRFFSTGIGRVRGAVVAALRGTPAAPVGVVERETTSDIVTLAVSHASEAARRTAGRWSARADGAALVSSDPSLWSATATLAAELEPRLHEWVARIAEDVRARGASKKSLAFGASLGVNVVGIAVMLGVFAHTAGITGAEVGVAAATGFVNQKLLQALFGEAAMAEMIDRARADLDDVLAREYAAERSRFERLVADPSALRALAAELRDSVSGTPE